MKNFLYGFLLLFILYSCDENQIIDSPKDKVYEIEHLSGHIQKGPYNNGTTITISELNSELGQTGRSFKSEIKDNLGSFEISNITLESPYVLVEANGFYFNECTGDNSEAQLTLSAIANIEDQSTLNVNLLSHLEKDRVIKLVKEGMAFDSAKLQVQKEIFDVFEMTNEEDTITSEHLDITKEGSKNAKLLAISTIMQMGNSTSDLSKLVAELKTDIYDDGKLTADTIGIQLTTQASIINTIDVREILESKYQIEGVDGFVPDFENYLNLYIENTPYEPVSMIKYPTTTDYGENILKKDVTKLKYGIEYSLAANLDPSVSLKVVISGGLWYYYNSPEGPINWGITTYNNESQSFTAQEGAEFCDLKIFFPRMEGQNDITIDYYENGSNTPSFSKTLQFEEVDYSTVIDIPENGAYGPNLLSLANQEQDTIYVTPDIKYSIEFDMLEEIEIQSMIKLSNDRLPVNITIDQNEIINFDYNEFENEYRLYVTFVATQQKYSASIVFNDHGRTDFLGMARIDDNGEFAYSFKIDDKVIIW